MHTALIPSLDTFRCEFSHVISHHDQKQCPILYCVLRIYRQNRTRETINVVFLEKLMASADVFRTRQGGKLWISCFGHLTASCLQHSLLHVPWTLFQLKVTRVPLQAAWDILLDRPVRH